jgi:DNA invertase Pin-like site-specific DNA recombinase
VATAVQRDEITSISHRVRFIVVEPGADVDACVLPMFAALVDNERAMIARRIRLALTQKKGRTSGRRCGKPGGGGRLRGERAADHAPVAGGARERLPRPRQGAE